MRRVRRWCAPVLLVPPLLACGDSGPAEPPPPSLPPSPVPTSIVVSPPSAVLRQDETFRFTATVHDQHDRPMAGAAVNWRSSDPTTATVDSTGLVTAVQTGEATITAAAGTVTGRAAVTVDDALADRAVLALLYEATTGSGWKNNRNWLSDAPLADWYGVDVDADGRVTRLRLGENGLEGGIPAQIGRLSRLTELQLNDNALMGLIPWEIGELSELRRLGLRSNDLVGWIPATLGDLTQLTRLSLEHNDLTGPIPPELGGLSRLDTLTLWNNELRGSIPPELGALSELRILYLGHNHLRGSIPPELGDLSRLQEFYANSNNLSGPIPPEIGRLSELDTLGLWSNGLAGSILLAGPEGIATLDGESGPPAALLRDPRTGRVRGILRDLTNLDGGLGTLAGAAVDRASIASLLPDAADLKILVSRGIPAANQWRR